MKVIEHLERAKGPLISYEIVPPPRGKSIKSVTDIVKELVPFNPPWIDVTAHSAAAFYNERPDGTVERRIYKKRPGTIGICGIIQNRFKIDTVTHLLCRGFTKEETEDALLELNYMGVHNILALRGDGLNYTKPKNKDRTENRYASDLVEQVSNINQGKFIDEIDNPGEFDFGIGVAGYPEKHFEAPNLKTDIEYLKKKVDAGAEYIMTQMFFDNQKYFTFVKAVRDAGIKVPIIPGLKVIRNANQLISLPKNFYIDIPSELADEIGEAPEHASQIGVNWAIKQVQGLLDFGAPCIHFYIMNDTTSILQVVKKFR